MNSNPEALQSHNFERRPLIPVSTGVENMLDDIMPVERSVPRHLLRHLTSIGNDIAGGHMPIPDNLDGHTPKELTHDERLRDTVTQIHELIGKAYEFHPELPADAPGLKFYFPDKNSGRADELTLCMVTPGRLSVKIYNNLLHIVHRDPLYSYGITEQGILFDKLAAVRHAGPALAKDLGYDFAPASIDHCRLLDVRVRDFYSTLRDSEPDILVPGSSPQSTPPQL